MKNNLNKRIFGFLIMTLLSLTITSTAFAAETSTVTRNKEKSDFSAIPISFDNTAIMADTLTLEDSKVMTILDNNIVAKTFYASGMVPTNGTLNLYPHLNNYVGLNKTFIVNAVSESTTGGLFLYLYAPNGNLVSDDWIMSTNEIAKWSVFLPSAGEWRLYIVGLGTNAEVDVFTRWE